MITRNFFVCLFLIIGKIIKSVPGKLMKEVSLPGCQCFNFNNYFHMLTNLEASKKFVWKLSFGMGWVCVFFFFFQFYSYTSDGSLMSYFRKVSIWNHSS